MAEESQKKNRVLYNVQDLYFGLISGELNSPYVQDEDGTEIEIIKRIHRVQSVSYDFNTIRQDIGILGKSSFDDNVITQPPDINVNITHTLEGLNNEHKMGFNILSIGANNSSNKEFTRSFLFSGTRQQNIYLAVNQNQTDIREAIREPNEIQGLIDSGRYGELGHSNTDKMGMVVFQNAYLTNYALDVSLGGLPKADTSWTCDNAIYLNTASGQYVSWLDSETATTYNKKSDPTNPDSPDIKFMVPGNYKRTNPNFDPSYTFKPSDATVTIVSRPAESDTLLNKDFEDGGALTAYKGTQSNDSTTSYAGTKSLKIVGDNTGVGVRVDMPHSLMEENQYYTLEAYVKTNSSAAFNVQFSVTSDISANPVVTSNLSTFTSVKQQDGWLKVKKRVKLDSVKQYLYIFSNEANKNLWIDNLKIYKDAENPPLRFHTDLMQSFTLNVPLPRDNISVVGHKYYLDRALMLPVKSTFSIALSSQDGEFPVTTSLGEDVKGDFLDNLRTDEEYDVYLTFTDDLSREGMKFRIMGSRFESVNYGADIDNNKTSTINFSMSNDYDYGRNVIAAEGKGLFVLDFLVNDSLVTLTNDGGDPLVDQYPHNF